MRTVHTHLLTNLELIVDSIVNSLVWVYRIDSVELALIECQLLELAWKPLHEQPHISLIADGIRSYYILLINHMIVFLLDVLVLILLLGVYLQ
jgi:hypothetical protein